MAGSVPYRLQHVACVAPVAEGARHKPAGACCLTVPVAPCHQTTLGILLERQMRTADLYRSDGRMTFCCRLRSSTWTLQTTGCPTSALSTSGTSYRWRRCRRRRASARMEVPFCVGWRCAGAAACDPLHCWSCSAPDEMKQTAYALSRSGLLRGLHRAEHGLAAGAADALRGRSDNAHYSINFCGCIYSVAVLQCRLLSQLRHAISSRCCAEGSYFIFDCPGQVEYRHRGHVSRR